MRIRKRIGIAVITFIFAVMLTGCDFYEFFGIETYTVWTGSQSYSVFSNQFGTLRDGDISMEVLTDSEFNQISKSLSDNNKHSWTEDDLKEWFSYSRGFNSNKAEEGVKWLKAIKHGWLCSRYGSVVYILVK